MFNERHVAQRIIEAACAIDWPAPNLQVQVLDDSTDESAQVARACCAALTTSGKAACDLQHIHRTDRKGFKAGALQNGLASATGEFIVIFDADFVPPADVLRRAMARFDDPAVGMVQMRWSHLNRDDSLLTQVQALYLDGHFVIEQTARALSGRWFNFNGTAGIWRRTAIEDAGGWQHDTLTEDTDISYRAQLNGWRFVYLPDVCCPAELPPTVSAFVSQQYRWNKGLIQTAVKLLPRIFASQAPLPIKLEAWFHLTAPIVNVFILLLVLLIPFAMYAAFSIESVSPIIGAVVAGLFFVLGLLGACTFYFASQTMDIGVSAKHGASPTRSYTQKQCGKSKFVSVAFRVSQCFMRLSALMAIGVGMSVSNSRAVISALCGRRSPFIRTPKFNGKRISDLDPLARRGQRKRRLRGGAPGLIELALAALMIATCIVHAIGDSESMIAAPFLALFAAGYFSVGWPLLRDHVAQIMAERKAAKHPASDDAATAPAAMIPTPSPASDWV